MAGKKETRKAQTVEPTIDNPVNQDVPEVENTPMETTTTATATATDRGIIDMLSPDCPIDELKDRYTDAEKEQIRDMVRSGAIKLIERTVTISADKANSPNDETQGYWAYVVTGTGVDLAGEPIAAIAGMQALANGNIRRADYETFADRKPANDTEKAQKDAIETKGATDYFDYGYDLTVRSVVRAYLAGLLIGPQAEIAKQVKALFKSKIAKSKQRAFDMVTAERIENGESIPEGLTLEKLNINWGK